MAEGKCPLQIMNDNQAHFCFSTLTDRTSALEMCRILLACANNVSASKQASKQASLVLRSVTLSRYNLFPVNSV